MFCCVIKFVVIDLKIKNKQTAANLAEQILNRREN